MSKTAVPANVEVFRVLVPYGHPMDGVRLDLYPACGATTYLEGTLEFTSPERAELSDGIKALRTALTELGRGLGPTT